MTYALARLGVAILLGGSLLGAEAVASVDLVGQTAATYVWEVAPGPVAGYAVYVARNGGSFPAVPEVTTPATERTARIVGQVGDSVVVRVAAFDAASTLGPFSPSSELVRFLEAPPPPPAPVPAPAPDTTSAPAPDPLPPPDAGTSEGGASAGAIPPPPASPPPSSDLLFAEDFEVYAPGQDAAGWLDTGAGNDLVEAGDLFSTVLLPDGNTVLGTFSTAVNVHSHWVGEGSRAWTAYDLRGRMLVDDARGGIGVTVFSDYPSSDTYYRLRRYQGNAFHLAPHDTDPGASCDGVTTSNLVPEAGAWVRFRFQATPGAAGTRLRAKVWPDGQSEPELWEIDCVDSRTGAFQSGHIGVWSMGPGAKYWDDLEVLALGDPVLGGPAVGGIGEQLYAEDFEAHPAGADPTGWLDTGAGNSLDEAPYLFHTIATEGGNTAFGTRSVGVNIHSHWSGTGSETWSSYELRGRMRVTHRWGGVGVTLFSGYPGSNRYYRLRRYWGNSFHLAPHGPGLRGACVGATDTGVVPAPGVWYRLRFQALPEGGGSHLRARIWREDRIEPGVWQVDCVDASPAALQAGRPGLWAMGPGEKHWDDLEVRALLPAGGP